MAEVVMADFDKVQFAVDTTQAFLAREKPLDNIWLGDTFEHCGKEIQSVVGDLNLGQKRAGVEKYLSKLYPSSKPDRFQVLDTWSNKQHPDFILAEVAEKDGLTQLGWFKLDDQK